MPLQLTDEQLRRIQPLDPGGFAEACSKARAARLVYEQKRRRNRTPQYPVDKGGRPVRHYRTILAADIARLMLAAGIEPKVLRGEVYEDAQGAMFHHLFQLAQQISGDRVLINTTEELRAGLDVKYGP